jgi:hypothetical protein
VTRGIRKWTGSTLGLQTTLHRIVFLASAGLNLQLNLGGMSKYVRHNIFFYIPYEDKKDSTNVSTEIGIFLKCVHKKYEHNSMSKSSRLTFTWPSGSWLKDIISDN